MSSYVKKINPETDSTSNLMDVLNFSKNMINTQINDKSTNFHQIIKILPKEIAIQRMKLAGLTQEEINKCCKDPTLFLKKSHSSLPVSKNKNKGPKYIPLARRGDKPDAIAWIVKNHPEVKNNQISKLIGTTKDTIEKIRTRTHWNISNITAKHPVLLSLCTQEDLDEAIIKAGGILDAQS